MRGLVLALFAGNLPGRSAGGLRAHDPITEATAKTTTKTV